MTDETKHLLRCPCCDELCEALPAITHLPDDGEPCDCDECRTWPDGWWEDGDTATCECGAVLMVDVDDGHATLTCNDEDNGS